MILVNFFIGFFTVFIAHYSLLYYYTSLRYSLVVLFGFIISLSIVWFGLLVSYYLKLPNISLVIVAWCSTVVTWYYILKKNSSSKSFSIITILLISFLLMAPAIQNYAGDIFGGWDAIASWNRWALELYENQYRPIDAAYPLLIPALLGFFYKLQDTFAVWWSVKLLLFTIPFTTIIILLALYKEKKNPSFLWFLILFYPFLISPQLFYGYVDMPVMVMGTLTLITLYASETEENNTNSSYYLIAALLLAGLTSIIKQAGMIFLLFTIFYIFLNHKKIKSKKTLFLAAIISSLYLVTFFLFYYQHAKYGIVGNLDHLKHISKVKLHQAHDFKEYFSYLWDLFFSYPSTPPIANALLSPFSHFTITPILILLAYLLFFTFKPLRNFKSVGFISSIFLILGIAVWIKYFSYDARNSYWVKSFFIIFAGINFAFLTKRIGQYIDGKKILFFLFFATLCYLYFIGDNYTVKHQNKYQAHLGDQKVAALIAKKLQSSNQCTKLYTTDHMIRYNTILFPLREKTYPLLGLGDFKKFVEHNCTSGEYFLFRKQSVLNPDWAIVNNLVDKGYLQPVKNPYGALLFYMPPAIKIEKELLNYRTALSTIKLGKTLNDLSFHIGSFKIYDTGIVVSGWGIIKKSQVDTTKKYIVLKNEKSTFIVETASLLRKDVTKVFKAKNLDNSGFKAKIYFDDFPKGKYNIYLLLIDQRDKSQHTALIKSSFVMGEK